MGIKGQQAVSAVLVSGILIGVVGSVYFWGIPLIQKSRDTSVLESAESLMFLIDQKVKNVASVGGRENIKILEPGILKFSGGTITYSVSTDGTIYATDSNIPLGRTSNCDTTKAGAFGTDDASVFCASSQQLSDSKYDNTYTLSYRDLTSGLNVYRLSLTGGASSGSKDSSIIIQNDGVTEVTSQGGKKIVTVSVRITIE